MGQHDLLGASDERILLGQREVAAGADVDDGLFWFGCYKELDAVVVCAEVQKDAADCDEDCADRNQWSKWVGDDQVHEFAKCGPAVATFDLLGALWHDFGCHEPCAVRQPSKDCEDANDRTDSTSDAKSECKHCRDETAER